MLARWIKSQSRKLFNRTEWQAFLLSVGVMFANHFFDLGLTEIEVLAMFAGSGTYAMGRGRAKQARVNTTTKSVGAVSETESTPSDEAD